MNRNPQGSVAAEEGTQTSDEGGGWDPSSIDGFLMSIVWRVFVSFHSYLLVSPFLLLFVRAGNMAGMGSRLLDLQTKYIVNCPD